MDQLYLPLEPITCSGDQMRQNGVSREDPRRDAKDPRSRQESEYGLASFQPTISAKEKTGVDPLSQVSMPLNKIKGQIDILQTEGMNPSHPNASRVRSSISGSWTDHKNRPLKSKKKKSISPFNSRFSLFSCWTSRNIN